MKKYVNIPKIPYSYFPLNKGTLIFLKVSKSHELFDSYQKQYGNTYYLNIYKQDIIATADVSFIKYILRNRDLFPNPDNFRKALTHEMDTSMFSAEGELWKKKHNVIAPLMRTDMLQSNIKQVFDKMNVLFGNIECNGNQEVELISHLKKATLDIIGEAAFGVNFQAQNDGSLMEGYTYAKVISIFVDALNWRSFTPPFMWNLPIKSVKEEKYISTYVKETFKTIYNDLKDKLDKVDNIDDYKMSSLTELIYKYRRNNPETCDETYPFDHILGESFSLWIAGHDSTTISIAHYVDLLSRHPDKQEKLREEVLELYFRLKHNNENNENNDDEDNQGVSSNNIPIPSLKDLDKLEYLSASFKESQRLYPLVTGLLRQCNEDVSFEGKFIPKGTQIFINNYHVQRSEDNYENPLEFIPERFLDKKIHDSFTHLSFGAALRKCYGKKFALLEIKLFIYLLLLKYEVLPTTEKAEKEFIFGLTPKNKELVIKLKPIDIL